MKSNKQQQRIFDAPISQNIAVSAGAGTGKSTTLKRKVIDLIKNRVYKPSEFLIVTFTNDAANSLRNKIKLGIREQEGCEDLISEVDSMHIDTLDAFRLFIVKKYALSIGLTGNVGVLDADVMLLEEYKILDRLLVSYYENNDPILVSLIDNYLVKNDDAVCKAIVSIANILDVTNKTKQQVVDEYKAKYLDRDTIQNSINEFLRYHYGKLAKLVAQLFALLDTVDLDDDGNEQKDVTYLRNKCEMLFSATTPKEYYEAFKYYKSFKGRLNGKGKYNQYDQVSALNSEIGGFKNIYVGDDQNDIEIAYNNEYIPFLVGIAYDLKTEIDKFMKDKGVYRFQDLSKLALKVLENEDVLNEIKSSFKMIMIDEYQDNSDEDDAFFTKISADDLFLVGDVKQSIYGFKGANPGKFMDKYDKYSKENADKNPNDADPYTMNINYRSRKEILSGVNDIFEHFMDLKYGGVNYKDNHDLRYENHFLYDNCPEPEDKDKGITKIDIGEKENLVAVLNTLTGEETFTELDIKGKEYLATCALNILDRINKGAKVASSYKDENGETVYELRNATFKDFSVLTRNNVDSEACRNIFNALGIPVNIVADEKITQDTMVVTLISFLKIISLLMNDEGENVKVDGKYIYIHEHEVEIKHYFASICRSFVFKFNDQDLYDYVGDTKYDENHKLIPNYKYRETDLYIALDEFAKYHKSSSLSEIVTDIVNQFGFVNALSRLGNAVAYLQKLTKLIEKIAAMDDVGYQLSDLFNYFENMDKLNLSFEVRLGNDSNNAVTIETFHKSKGLEFPIIYIECTKEMKSSKNRTNSLSGGGAQTQFYGNVKTGFFLPMKTADGDQKKHLLISEYTKMLEDKDAVSEETRLFYVALTRAKECAICVYPTDEKLLKYDDKEDVNTYAALVKYSKFNIRDDAYGYGTSKLTAVSKEKPVKHDVDCLENKITYEPINKTTHRPSIKEESEVSDYLLKKGIRYHAYMQYVDFVSKDTSFIKSKYDRNNIDRVLSLPIFQDLDGVRVYKEYNYYDEDIDENGIIDLLLVYEDHCVVVDYKLKNADEFKYTTQLEAYKNYVEKVFKKPTETMLISLLGN